MFWQDLDPGYYQNPSGFTYLVYALLRGLYGPLGFAFGLPFGNVTEQFSKDPGEIWVAARDARRRALHGRRGRHLRGRAAAVGGPRGADRGGGAGIRLPAGRLFAGGRHRRRLAGRCRARAALVGPRGPGRAHARLRARRRGGRPGSRFKYTAGLVLLAARDRGAGAAARRPLRGRSARWRSAGARGSRGLRRCSTRTCSARSAIGGPTCATRPTSPPTTQSPGRSPEAWRTTSTA